MIDAERAEPYHPRDSRPLLAFKLSHGEMVERFGPPHRQTEPGDNEPGPCEYWSFQFPCGLTVFITYHFHSPPAPSGDVCASSPDIGHILAHLPAADCLFWRLDDAEPDLYRSLYENRRDSCSMR